MEAQQEWYVSGQGRFIYARDETIPVARMCPGPNMPARGKLISAAPDMLAALRAVESAQQTGDYGTAFDQVRAVLARIDGAP